MVDLEAARRLAREAAERASAATPGKWTNDGSQYEDWTEENGYCEECVVTPSGTWWCSAPSTGHQMSQQRTDGRFIAAARENVPELARAVVELAEEVERLRGAIEHALTQVMPATDAAEILRAALETP